MNYYEKLRERGTRSTEYYETLIFSNSSQLKNDILNAELFHFLKASIKIPYFIFSF